MRIILPLYVGMSTYNYDPAYVYLLNGVSIFLGFPAAHADHPGTPTQVVIALVAGLWWSLFDRAPGTLMDAALADPEKYVRMLGLFFLGCNVAANWFLGRRVSAAAASLPVAVIAQTGPLFLGILAPRLVYASPEPMLLALTMTMLGLLSGEIFGSRSRRPGLASSLAAGALGGVALAAKLTFAPMLAVLFVVGRDRRLLACLLAAFVAMIVSLLPVYEYAGAIVRWVLALATHKGHYGTGERGIVLDVPVVVAQLKKTWDALPILYAGLIAASIALFLRFDRVSAAILAALALQLGLVAKPIQLHYLASGVPLATVALARLSGIAGARLAGLSAVLAVGLGCLWTGVALQGLRAERATRSAEVREIEKVLVRYPGARIIGAYPAPEWTYALNFALGYTAFPFRLEASVKIPSDISYHGGGLLAWVSAGYGPLRFLTPYLAAGRPVLLLFPRDIPFDRFECEEPVRTGGNFHVCRVLKVLDPE